LSEERKLHAWPLTLAIPILVVHVLLTGSRGGVASLLVGALFVAIVVARQRRFVSGRVALALGGAAACGVALALVIAGEGLLRSFADRDIVGKVSVWKWSLDLIGDFPAFGVGRGAFESAFQPYRQLLGRDWTMVFPYTENFPLQWVTDWGLAVAAAALIGLGLTLARSFARARHELLSCGLAVGIGALLLQNLVDLALEIFGVVALALVAFSGVTAPSSGTPRSRLSPAFPAAFGVLACTLIVLVTGAAPLQAERQRVSREYSEWVRSGARHPRAFLAELRATMLRHPAEAYFPLVASVVAARLGDDPLRWIGRALDRSPLDGHAHLLLSDALAKKKATPQALMHLRLAAVYDGVIRDAALAKAAALATSHEELLGAFPPNMPGATLLPEVCQKVVGAIRVECWREVHRRNALDAHALRELARALLDALEAGAAPCAAQDTAACAAEAARCLGAIQKGARDWQFMELRARELALAGDFRGAATLLIEHCPSVSEAVGCRWRAVELGARAKDMKLLGVAVERYTTASCGEQSRCASAHERSGAVYDGMGAASMALKHFSAAASEEPSVERWIQSAEAAARAGSAVSTKLALERARREGDLNPDQLRRVENVESSLAATSRPAD
jgi:hypothetical protein